MDQIIIKRDDDRFQEEITRMFENRSDERITREQFDDAMWKWLHEAVDYLLSDASYYAAGVRPIAGGAYSEPYPVEP